MKAELKVPSPSIRRKRLGKVKASKKASPKSEAPKVAKNKMSLIRPNILESIVAPLTKENLLSKLNLPVNCKVKNPNKMSYCKEFNNS